jgi:hypothetical protein
MKKLLSIGMLTVCALALTERPADAWVNSKFSIGLNWHLQSGNNNVLWGLWKNGQVPGPEAFGGHGGPMQFGPQQQQMMPPANGFPFYGNSQPMPQAYPAQTPPPQTAQQYSYNPYQAVSYQPNTGYYYPQQYTYPSYYSGYGQPSGYSQQQVPYYWYQGR